jgi:hypothetical protein
VIPPNVERQAASVLREIEKHGLLLETDPKLPSLVAIVAGGPVRGSWWGHPLGHTIFAIGESLFDSHKRDVLLAKLVSGKATWIHRSLWPAFLAVASSREAWQTDGLTSGARALLAEVDAGDPVRASGAIARELEVRLLARDEQEHTASGRHAKVLEAWPRWGQRLRVSALPSAESGRRILEQRLDDLNERFGGHGRLPWQEPPARKPRRSGSDRRKPSG